MQPLKVQRWLFVGGISHSTIEPEILKRTTKFQILCRKAKFRLATGSAYSVITVNAAA
jgi:hypothetical protein